MTKKEKERSRLCQDYYFKIASTLNFQQWTGHGQDKDKDTVDM